MLPFHRATIISLISALPVFGAANWSTDFEASRLEAAEEGKSLLLDFTGSDWCGWCIKLRKEVFEQDGFDEGVEEDFVLVELDYPQDKSKQDKEVVEQNAELLKRYPISGYPTILLCDSDGKPYAATGYREGGPEVYLEHLDELLEKKSERDEALAAAGEKEGVAKARALIAVLDDLDLPKDITRSSYPDVAEAIRAADPSDETGFASKRAGEARFAEFMADLGALRSKQDLDGVDKLIEEALEDPLIQGEERQQVYGHHAGTLASAGHFDKAITVLEKAVKEDPDGPRTKELQDFIKILETEKAKKEDSEP
jgi:thiol-disulfide isomerase/thioredoxin